MDYTELSRELMKTLHTYYHIQMQRKLNNAAHGEAFALQYIYVNNGMTMPSEIKTAMSVSSARIATVLNGLEDKGLITRQVDSKDRRRTILKLTPEGEKKAIEAEQKLLKTIIKTLEFLGEEDAKDCVRIIGRLTELDYDECE